MNLEMTHEEVSRNKTNWEQYLELTFVAAHGLILFATFFVGSAANVFVLLAVYNQKALQTSNNALVVNLAVIDFLRCVIDCPVLLTIVSTVYRSGHAEGTICDVQVVSFSFSCCVQLLTLACISAERYQAISQPFKNSQRRRRIMVLISLTWIVAIVVALICLVFLKDSPVYVKCQGNREDKTSYDTFGLYMVLPLWAACFSVIIGFYARIFILVKSHNRKIFDKGLLPVPEKGKAEEKQQKVESKREFNTSIAQVETVTQAAPNSSNKDAVPALLTPKPLQCISFGSGNEKELKNTLEIIELETEQPCAQTKEDTVQGSKKPLEAEESELKAMGVEVKPSNEDIAVGVKSSASKPPQMSNNLNIENPPEKKTQNDKSLLETNPVDLNVQTSAHTNNPETPSVLPMNPEQANNNSTGDQASPITPVTHTETDAAAQNENIEGAVCMMPSRANRERANKKKESKMAKRAGYIVITFLLFWLPIITTIIMNSALYKNKNTEVSIGSSKKSGKV